MRDSSPPCVIPGSPPCVIRRHLFSSLGFYERSASAACSRRAAHALRRLGFRFLKESESDLLDARSGLWSAAFSSREESKSRLAARPPRRFFLVRCSDILSDSSPSTHTGLQLIVCARAAPRLAEGFMPVAPARAVTARSTLRAFLRPPAGSRSRFHCGHPATSQVLLQLRAQHTCEVWVVELDDPNPRQSTQRERVRVVVG